MTPHPPLSALEAYAAGKAPEVAPHVESCGDCQSTVTRLVEDNALLADLAAAVAVSGTEDAAYGETIAPSLPGYADLELLSRGGQGAVYRATQCSTHRTVAIKVLLGGAFTTSRSRARFEREVELAAGLAHPNLVTVHDSGTTAEGSAYFAMEYVDGRPVHRWARGRPASEVLPVFATACAAVDFAHRRGVIHRDLKPANLLVDGAGQPHVLDFGLAVARAGVEAGRDGEDGDEDAPRLTRTGEFVGTLAYASPEHVSGDPATIDVRSDVYSLGVMLWELVTGGFPYPVDGGLLEVAQHVREREPRLGARLDADLETVLRKALAKDPERRYGSAGALATDLRRWLEGAPVDARRDSAWYVLRKTLRRHWIPASVAALFLALVVGGAITTTALWGRAELERRAAVAQGERAGEMSRFFLDLLDSIDPDRAKGRAVEVREVLDDASQRLADDPPRSVEAELELRAAVGRAYGKLGLAEDGIPHLLRAVELARNLPAEPRERHGLLCALTQLQILAATADEAERTLEELVDLQAEAPDLHPLARASERSLSAQLSFRRGERNASAAILEEAIALYARAGGDPSPVLADAYLDISHAYHERGELTRAEEYARAARSQWERLGDVHTVGAATSLARLGSTLAEARRLREALPLLEEAHAELARLLGPDHSRTLSALAMLVSARARAGGWLAAEPLFRGALAHRADLLARRDAYAAWTLTALGRLADDAGELDLAEELLREALATYDAIFSRHSFNEALVRESLARVLWRRGHHGPAEELARESLAMSRAVLGSGTEREANALDLLAAIRTARGHWEEGRELAEESLRIRRTLHGDEHPRVATSLLFLGVVRYLDADLSGAEQALREGLALHDALELEDPLERARLLLGLGDVRIDAFDAGGAVPLLREALGLFEGQLGPRHPQLAEARNALGRALFATGERGGEPKRLWDEALAIYGSHGADHPQLPWVLNNLGTWAWFVEGDAQAGEDYLLESLEVAERTAPPNHPLLAITLANLAHFEHERGEHAAAVPRLERALEVLEAARGPDNPFTVRVREKLEAVRAAAVEPEDGS